MSEIVKDRIEKTIETTLIILVVAIVCGVHLSLSNISLDPQKPTKTEYSQTTTSLNANTISVNDNLMVHEESIVPTSQFNTISNLQSTALTITFVTLLLSVVLAILAIRMV